jgi:hypothetical protein
MSRSPRHRRPLIEALEPRLLFSATADIAVFDDGNSDGQYLAQAAQEVDLVSIYRLDEPSAIANDASDVDPQADLAPLVTSSITTVVFVDTAVENYETLMNDIRASVDANAVAIIYLDSAKDGLAQISDYLAGVNNISAVHIISHGSAGSVILGNMQLDVNTLFNYEDDLLAWREALTDDADILFYGCSVAATPAGQQLITQIAALTAADVAASDDATGHVAKQGDWELEFAVGGIENEVLASADTQAAWEGVLSKNHFVSVQNGTSSQTVSSVISVGQSFSFDNGGQPYTINQVSIQLKFEAGASPQDVTLQLLDGGWSDSSPLAVRNINFPEMTTTYTWATVDFGNVVLNSGQTYVIRLQTNNPDGKVSVAYNNSNQRTDSEMIVDGVGDANADLNFLITFNNRTNQPPVNTVPGLQHTGLNAPLVFSAANGNQIQIFDADDFPNNIAMMLQATNGTFSLAQTTGLMFSVNDGVNDKTMTFRGSVDDINAALATLTYTPDADFSGIDSFKITSKDSANAQDVDTVIIKVNFPNHAPVVATAISDHIVQEATPLNFSFPTNTFSDQDGDALTYAAKLADGSPLPSWITFNPTTRTFSGVADDINIGVITIRVTATDIEGLSVYDDFTLTVTNLPEPPFVANPIPNQTAFGFTQFTYVVPSNTFGDPDGSAIASYRATLGDGSSLPGWLTLNSATGTFSGVPTNGNAGTITIKLYATDSTGLESPTPDQFNIVITATANDAPVNTVPGAQATDEDTPLVFSLANGNQIQIADADAFSSSVRVTLGVLHGVLTLASTAGLSFSAGDGTNDATLVFTGTIANINAALATLTYTPDGNYRGSDTLSIETDDLGNSGTGGAKSDSDTVAITVNTVNDAPVNAVPGAQTATEDTAFVFSAANGNQIQINDVDVGSGDLEITLSVTNGTLTLAGTAGLVFSSGDGTADTSVIFRGTQADINAALATITFNPTADYNGAAVLSITTSDLGNAGAGGPLTDTDTVNITINAVNDAPTVANPIPDRSVNEDAAFNFQFAANTFNDIDVGNTLVYSAQLAGGGALPGWLSFNAATRTFSGTPLNANVGTVSIDVIASDGQGGTVTDTFDITVVNTNDAPTVANTISNKNAVEDAAFSFQFADDTFIDQDVGDSLTYTAQLAGGGVLPAWLTFDAATRTFSGTPANGDVGTISVRVIAADGHGGTGSDTFDIVIANTNDKPTLANAIPDQTVAQGTLLNFTFAVNTFNDQDVGDSLTYTAKLAGGDPLPSWLTFDAATRTFSGTPDNGDVGTITVEVTASDGSESVSDIFDITVGNVDDSPVLVHPIPNQNATEDFNFSFQFAEDTFKDPDPGDVLSYSATMADGSPLVPWLLFDATTRTFSGIPANGDVGTISVKVTAADPDGGPTASATFDIVIANTNDAPTVANSIGSQNASEDAAFNFTFAADTFNDQDVGDTLSYSAQLAGGGALPTWLSFDALTRTFSGTPANGDVGTVAIDVIANDGNGGTVTDTFNIVVANTNDAPVVDKPISDQNATQDIAFNFQFAADTFSDEDGNTLSYSANLSGGAALPAWLSFDATTRTFSGTPTNGDVETLSIDVIANDGNGGTVTETFTIVIANVNDAPTVAIALGDYYATEQTTLNLHGTGITVADIDGDSLTVTITGEGASQLSATVGTTGVVVSGTGSGTLILTGTAAQLNNLFAGNNGSTLTYYLPGDTPAATRLLTITANDGSLSASDTTTIHITAVNDGPVNTVPTAQITDEDTALVFSAGNGNQIQINDLDAGSSNLEVTLSVTNGTLTLAGITGLVFSAGDGTADSSLVFRGTQANINAALATLTFNPTANYHGTAVLTITTSDMGNAGTGGTLTDSDNINITVTPINDGPTLANPIPNQIAPEDSAFNFQFSASAFADVDLDVLTFTVQLADGSALPAWLSFDSATRTFSGTPTNGDVGILSINIAASDGSTTVTDSFTLTVTNTNDAPTVANLIADRTATEDLPFSFQFAANTFSDADVGDTLTYSAQLADGSALPSWLSFDATTRTFSGTPENGDVGTISIDVIANDGNGGTVTATFAIVIANTNDAPIVANPIPNQTANEDAAFNYQFPANTFTDADVGDALTYTAQLGGGGALPTWLIFDAVARTFSGTPTNDDIGTLSISVTADDGKGGTISETFALVINNTNDAPIVANPITDRTATEDSPFNFQFAANTFSDVDVGDTLTYSAQLADGSALPSWLSFDAATRTFSGTPLNGDVGTLSIDVIADDGKGGTVTASFDIVIDNANDAPTVANPITDRTATEDSLFSFQFAANTFSDVDIGDTLTYSAQLADGSALPSWLSFDAATRTFSGTPLNGDVGTISIDVIANDGNGGTVAATFDIVIANTNDVPTVANPITDRTATEDLPFSFQFAANTFSDVDVGDALTYTAQLAGGGALPSWLSFDAATRTFSGIPADVDVGTINIDIIASDGNGGTVTLVFAIVVVDVNHAPATTGLSPVNNIEDAAGDTVDLFDAFTDDTDASHKLQYSVVGNSNPALVSVAVIDPVTGKLQLSYAANQFGISDLIIRAQDSQGAIVETALRITIASVNDTPTSAGIADVSVKAGAAAQQNDLRSVFSDIEDGVRLNYSLVGNSNPAVVTNVRINPVTGMMNLVFASAGSGESIITLRAMDADGAWVETQFKVIVTERDAVPPVTPEEPIKIPPVIAPTMPPIESPVGETPNTPTPPPDESGGGVGSPTSPLTPVDALDPGLPGGDNSLHRVHDDARDGITNINDKSRRDYGRVDEMLNNNSLPITTLNASSSLVSLITPDGGFAPWEEEDFDNEVRRIRAQMDEALEQEHDRKTVIAGLTFSVTTGLLIWSLRASSLLLTMMSMLPLWRGLDPLPILHEVNKKKKELEQQRKDREREDKSAKEVGYLFDHAQKRETGR